METDIIHQVREYFRLSITSGNHYQNTKYCIMYMLKTHKHHYDLFKKIHGSKTLADYAIALEIDAKEFEGLDAAYFQHFEGTYYRKNKHLIDVISEREGLLVPKQPGFTPDNKGKPRGKGVGDALVGQKRPSPARDVEQPDDEEGAAEKRFNKGEE